MQGLARSMLYHKDLDSATSRHSLQTWDALQEAVHFLYPKERHNLENLDVDGGKGKTVKLSLCMLWSAEGKQRYSSTHS
jgi:hypothetical protein